MPQPNNNHKKSNIPELGYFTSWPAGMMDNMYLTDSTSWWGRFWGGVKRRLTYTFLFTPLAVVDLATSGTMAASYAVRSFYTTDDTQKKLLKNQAKYSNIFSKNLYALSAFVFGLVNPKLVTFYFTPEKSHDEGIVAGGSYYHSKKTQIQHPEDVETLQQIVKDAASNGDKLMVVGAGRSQGKQFIPKGGNKKIAVDLDQFNTIEINKDEKTAIVGAGVRWYDLQLAANKLKLALQVMQASNVFSIGGSIGTNIHGWDHRAGSLSNTILEIHMINAKGEKQVLTPEDPLFHQVIGGFGLFGIVTSVKIQLTDNELLKEKGKEIPIANYVEHFRKNVETNPDIRMHLFRLSLDPKNLLSSGVAVDYEIVKNVAPRITPKLKPEGNNGTRFNRVMLNIARRIGLVRKLFWRSEKNRLLENDSKPSKPMTRNEIMQPPINAMFNPSVSESEWLQEYFIPGEQLEAFLKSLGQLLMNNKTILLNSSVRFAKQNPNSLLSYSKDGDRFAVVLCFNQSLHPSEVIKAEKWIRQAQELAIKHGGTYYLPYQHVSSPEDFHKAYPHAKEAFELKKQCDPQEIFSSGFYQKYIVPESEKPNYFKKIMATEETQKKFSGFLENVLQRVDSKKLYGLLSDIMQYNDSHAEIYKELCRRLPEIMPSKLSTMQQIFKSLREIKKDLLDQAKVMLHGTTKIDGLVEIGYPGRFVNDFKKNFKVTGQIVAVNEGESITDYIQTGFPRPYHKFAKLDYSKPNLASLADNSADVITCYVGLHHFPDNELETFLKDVRRVLRPGGKFLLVDHDVINDEAMAMAHMAHTIFNAVYGASLADELSETRNFHPMSHWQQILQKYDLGYQVDGPDVPMIREGDPTRNRMVSFVNKKPELQNTNTIVIPAVQPSPREKSKTVNEDGVKTEPSLVWKKDYKAALLSTAPAALHKQDNKFIQAPVVEVERGVELRK